MPRRIGFLGPTLVVVDGEERMISAPRQRSVLAHLAVNARSAVSSDRLLDSIWGDDQPAGGAKAVAFQISKLRDALEPDRTGEGSLILTTSAGYVLDLTDDEIDIHDIAKRIADARLALVDDPAKAATLADDALRMFRGRPFADVVESAELDTLARQLEQQRLLLRRTVLEAWLALGEHAEVAIGAEALAAEHPLEEQAVALQMRALHAVGRTADALRAYSALRQRLVDEIGIEPSPELRGLEAEILAAGDAEPATGLRTSIPTPPTSFLGREDEIAELIDLVGDDDVRHVTLTGIGGSGKTRLAIEVARRLRDDHDECVHFVSLVDVDDPASIPHAIGNSLGFVADQHIVGNGLDEQTQLFDFLAMHELVLVLDNLEHLVAELDVITRLITHCPSVTVIATSRERLGLSCEFVHAVGGLDTGSEHASAVALFNTRVRQSAGIVDIERDAASVAELTRLVDGHPLAVELAAGMTSITDVDDVLATIRRGLAQLETRHVDIPDRHQSLRAVFDGSWVLLDSDSQRALAALSMFRSPFDRADASAVAGADPSQLARLVDHSLVRRIGGNRYDLHPVVREFATVDVTCDRVAVRRAHAVHFAEWAACRTSELLGSERQLEVSAEVASRHADIRAAMLELAETGSDDALLIQALHAMHAHFLIVSMVEWAVLMGAVADALEAGRRDPINCEAYLWARVYESYPNSMIGDAATTERRLMEILPAWQQRGGNGLAWAYTVLGALFDVNGNVTAALEWNTRAWELDRDDDALLFGVLTSWRGWALAQTGESEAARQVWSDGLAVADAAQNLSARAYLISKLGLSAHDAADYAHALELQEQSRAIFERTGDVGGLGYALSRMSCSYRMLGDIDAAIDTANAGLEQFRSVNHRWGIGASMGRLGDAQLDGGDVEGAARSYLDCLDWGQRSDMHTIVYYAMLGLARMLAVAERDELAAMSLSFQMKLEQNPYVVHDVPTALDEIAGRIGPTAMAAAAERAERVSLDEVLDETRREVAVLLG